MDQIFHKRLHPLYHEDEFKAMTVHELDIFLTEIPAVKDESDMPVSISLCFFEHVLKLGDIHDTSRIGFVKQWFPVCAVICHGIVEDLFPNIDFRVSNLCQFQVTCLACLICGIVRDVDLLPVITLLVPFTKELDALINTGVMQEGRYL